mgnify:FL=1
MLTNVPTMLAEILKLLCPDTMLAKHPNSLKKFPHHAGKYSNKLSWNASKISQFITTISAKSMKFYLIIVTKILRVFLQILLQRMRGETMN